MCEGSHLLGCMRGESFPFLSLQSLSGLPSDIHPVLVSCLFNNKSVFSLYSLCGEVFLDWTGEEFVFGSMSPTQGTLLNAEEVERFKI